VKEGHPLVEATISSDQVEQQQANNSTTIAVKTHQAKCLPMLKWAGGKRRLLKHLIPIMKMGTFDRYFEPFFGGGALFFATQPQTAILSDTNEELINCYRYVRDYSDDVIDVLRTMENTIENYYRIRSEVPDDGLHRAARIIFLTTLSFNGLYRLNRNNEFNVPYGKKTHLIPCDVERLKSVCKALGNAELRCFDFEESVRMARRNDLIYFDPPYAICSGDGFVKYNSKVFTWDDQKRLAEIARNLSKSGCRIIVSNADVPEIRELYKGFQCSEIERSSSIAASGEFRKKITECIFYNEV
jgi:DNA adenine methylase